MNRCRLNQLRVVGVGPFQDVTLEFPSPTLPGSNLYVFTGVNGSGKTTALEAIAQVFALNSPGELWARLRSRFVSDESFVQFGLGDESGEYRIFERELGLMAAAQAQRKHVFKTQGFFASLDRGHCSEAHVKFLENAPRFRWDDPGRTAFATSAFAYSGRRSFETAKLGAIQEISSSPFEGALEFAKANSSATLVQWVANSYAKSAMALQDGEVEEANSLRKAVLQVELAMTQLAERPFQFFMKRSPLEVGVEYDGVRMPWSVLPDGIKSVVSWLSDLLMRLDRIRWSNDTELTEREFVLILDEVDIHLHPKWQRKILPLLSTLFPNAQIFVSTHSPFVVGSVDNAHVYTFKGTAGVDRRTNAGGASIPAILATIFDVPEEFSARAEKLLDEFRAERLAYLASGDAQILERLLQVGKQLSQMGPELQDIVSSELRQVEKLRASNFESPEDDAH